MEIRSNINARAVARTAPPQLSRNSVSPAGDTVFIQHAQALEKALAQTPSVRPEAVARAKSAIADMHWPPDETIRRIAALLAVHIEGISK